MACASSVTNCLGAGAGIAIALGIGYAAIDAVHRRMSRPSGDTARGQPDSVVRAMGGAVKGMVVDFMQFIVVVVAIFLTAMLALFVGPLVYTAKVRRSCDSTSM